MKSGLVSFKSDLVIKLGIGKIAKSVVSYKCKSISDEGNKTEWTCK